MRNFKSTFAIVALLPLGSAFGAFNLKSASTGSEGQTRFTDTTLLQIDASGAVVDPSLGNGFEDFEVSGNVTQSTSFGTNFSITIAGMSSVDDTTDLGAEITSGGIDRAANGNLGIRGGTNGIDEGEGYLVGLDATGLNTSLAFQITAVEMTFVGSPETGTIVNRNDTTKSLTFDTSGVIDVTALGLIVNGGTSDSDLVSIFAGDFGEGNFRVASFSLELVNSASDVIFLDSQGSGSEGDSRFSDTTALRIDPNGNAVDPNAGNGIEDFGVSGNFSQTASYDTDFSITITGVSSVDAEADLGASLVAGGIDRASNGDLGIRGGGGNGIDALEGYLVGLDVSNLDSSLAFQIRGVELSFVDFSETVTIVNRNNPSLSQNFNTSGLVDVSDLELIVNGGSSDSEIVSIFGDDFGAGSFRIKGFEISIIESIGGASLSIFRGNNGLAFDGSGDFLDPAGDGVENLLKYSFNMIGSGTNQQSSLDIPNVAVMMPEGDAGLPLIRYNQTSGKLEVTYIRRKAETNSGVTYEAQLGSNLQSLAANPLATESVISIDEIFERVTVTDSEGTPSEQRRFGRVIVTVN